MLEEQKLGRISKPRSINQSGFQIVQWRQVRVLWTLHVCRCSFVELTTLLLQAAGAPRPHVHILGKKCSRNQLTVIAVDFNDVLCSTGSVTGTEIVSTGTGQSLATGHAGTVETVIVVKVETDHEGMKGTIGTHQFRSSADHSADMCKFWV